jgi:arylformamidase
LDSFVGKCYVCHHEGDVTAEDAKTMLKKAGGGCKKLLIGGKCTVTAEAANVFAETGMTLIGNESQTVGPEDAPREVHLILLGAGAVLLEGIRLGGVEDGEYFLSAAPLCLGGSDGAPCRAYLIEM